MLRRSILIVFLLFLIPTALPSWAAESEESAYPYFQVPTVDQDYQTVRLYYATFCPYSKSFLPFFKNLARTGSQLTKLNFEPTPVVNREDGMGYAITYAAVRRFHHDRVWDFFEQSLIATQDKNMNMKSLEDIKKVLTSSGINPEKLRQEIIKNQKDLAKDVDWMIYAQDVYMLTNKKDPRSTVTPTVVIAGTYVTNPSFANGASSTFESIINALISMVVHS
jgi:hypothetical protein